MEEAEQGKALLLLPVGSFFVATWVAGELFSLMRAPLVGQIVVGVLAGPGLLDLVPHREAFELVGLMGLLLLVVGGGLHTNLGAVGVVGWRAFGVGLSGTALPVLTGWGFFTLLGFDSTTGYAEGLTTTIILLSTFSPSYSSRVGVHQLTLSHHHSDRLAAGIALAPSSIGIALKLLQQAGEESSQLGSLITTAAMLDDVLVASSSRNSLHPLLAGGLV